MYYVIYVGGGKEKTAEDFIMRYIPKEQYSGCFHPVRIMRRRQAGKVREIYQCLIPGYIFLITEDIKTIYTELRRVPKLTKILGQLKDDHDMPIETEKVETGNENLRNQFEEYDGESSYVNGNVEGKTALISNYEVPIPDVIPLSEEEVSWLLQLVADTPERYGPIYAGISHVGFDENDHVQILDGPLVNMQGLVKKINLHNRYAEVEINFLGQKSVVRLGIDILAREQ